MLDPRLLLDVPLLAKDFHHEHQELELSELDAPLNPLELPVVLFLLLPDLQDLL